MFPFFQPNTFYQCLLHKFPNPKTSSMILNKNDPVVSSKNGNTKEDQQISSKFLWTQLDFGSFFGLWKISVRYL